MIAAKTTFIEGIKSTRSLFSIYDHLLKDIHLPQESVSDLLRSQIVYAISSLDRLIHELVRIGILEIFENKRIATNKFNKQSFTAQTIINILKSLNNKSLPKSPDDLPSVIINKEIIEKLSFLAFQTPDKVKDALSYIWNEQNKFVVLAEKMGLPGASANDKQKYLEQTLSLISNRRNQIVHEADINPITGTRNSIDRVVVEESISFIERLGCAIYDIVTSSECYI